MYDDSIDKTQPYKTICRNTYDILRKAQLRLYNLDTFKARFLNIKGIWSWRDKE